MAHVHGVRRWASACVQVKGLLLFIQVQDDVHISKW